MLAFGRQFRRWKLKLQKRRRSHTGRNARWLLPPRSLIWIRLHSLLLLLIAIVTIGSFFEVIYVRLPFLCYFQSLFYLKQATQPVFSLVLLCLPSSCVVRTRRKIFFIWTNLVRENEEFFKTSLHNLHNVYKKNSENTKTNSVPKWRQIWTFQKTVKKVMLPFKWKFFFAEVLEVMCTMYFH